MLHWAPLQMHQTKHSPCLIYVIYLFDWNVNAASDWLSKHATAEWKKETNKLDDLLHYKTLAVNRNSYEGKTIKNLN